MGLGSTLLPGALWAQTQQTDGATQPQFTLEMLQQSLKLSGLEFSEEDEKAMLNGLNQNLTRYVEIRALKIPNDDLRDLAHPREVVYHGPSHHPRRIH